MFSKNSKGSNIAGEQTPAPKPSPPSIISADLKIVGDLSCHGEIQIDGSVDGDIRTKSLLVGETAQIKGEIVAEVVFVHGNITGQIKAREVNLAKTAHVVGDILHENLAIETGAFLEGHCKRMIDKSAPSDAKVNVFGSDDANRRLAKIKEGGAANVDDNKEGAAVVSS
ncbi:MAG: polymer-forming cytoskeletal protein [Proteobacteria bacterium]|nr:polymer-forming cytoskeletal protein [Pseudomonadota bacterium]